MAALSREDVEELEELVLNLAHAFNLKDYEIIIEIPDDDCEDCVVFAEVHFRNHWTCIMTFHDNFFEADEREQVLTVLHELVHVAHKRIDAFVDALAGDDESIRRAYDNIQEDFVEAMERALGNLLPLGQQQTHHVSQFRRKKPIK